MSNQNIEYLAGRCESCSSSKKAKIVLLFSAILCAFLLVIMSSQYAYAETYSDNGVDYIYEVDESDQNAITITAIESSSATTVQVPGVIEGKSVVGISAIESDFINNNFS